MTQTDAAVRVSTGDAQPDRPPRLIAFDLDDTLAASKQPLAPQMGRALAELLACRPVCVISGGSFEQFETQVLGNLPPDADLTRLHLMPTCGTRYLTHEGGRWREVYAHNLSPELRRRAIEALEQQARRLGLWEPDEKVAGPRIEDRGSQITFSALGQAAGVAEKRGWDPDGSKREKLRAAVAPLVPELEVRAGGSTSVDITQRGIDKAYGIRQLAIQTGIPLTDMLFIGDRLVPGGNDFPVAELGVPCHAVLGPEDTLSYLAKLTAGLRQ